MQMLIKTSLIVLCVLDIVACTPSMEAAFWNGEYSQRAAVRAYDKKSDAYYAKETPQQQEFRKKNRVICRELSLRPENQTKDGRQNSILYVDCMAERGSPMFRMK